MLRRLHAEQPESFAFTAANAAWAQGQIKKYPEGRQASAIIPLLWRAQEQEGWLSKPAIETVADMLDMPYIRALEVATFYFMFQLQPVGNVAHVQVCGTTSCMICGAEDLIAVCREKIAAFPHEISADGKLSWEEVECLGACANAPMVQIGKDFYEDLTAESFAGILDAFSRGEVPQPGPQNGRFAAEPKGGLTALKDFVMPEMTANASAARALAQNDTVARIGGDEVIFAEPAHSAGAATGRAKPAARKAKAAPTGAGKVEAGKAASGKADAPKPAAPKAEKPAAKGSAVAQSGAAGTGKKPKTLKAAKGGVADDLELIKGVGPKLEALCNRLGFFHFAQIAEWSADEVAWVDQNLEGFKGRVSRDEWVSQAEILAKGGETAFSKKSKKA